MNQPVALQPARKSTECTAFLTAPPGPADEGGVRSNSAIRDCAGPFVALTIIGLWFAHGASLLMAGWHLPWNPLVLALRIAVQSFLTTGLFITAHDAMHGSISKNRVLNDVLGRMACFLFAGMSYGRLLRNHRRHHDAPATEADPDYSLHANFVPWFVTFMARYTTLLQIVTMGALYNLLALRFDEASIVAFWVVPALLGSLQLFFFGTYLPHRPPHSAAMAPHNARSFPRNHVLAFVTCYFFGYHQEHHEMPWVPWYRLPSVKL